MSTIFNVFKLYLFIKGIMFIYRYLNKLTIHMMTKGKILVAVLLSIVMLMSAFFVFPLAPNGTSGLVSRPDLSVYSGQVTPAIGNNAVALHSPNISHSKSAYAHGALSKYVYLPDYKAASKYSFSDGHVSPLYNTAPAPMGIGDIGLMTGANGTVMPYNLTTSSFEGSISLNNLNPFYIQNDAPHSVTVQLNAVLNNVTILGNSNYVFWNQNVVFYSAHYHELEFIDNIWNFSSPSFDMTPNSIIYGQGTVVPGVFYYAIGPVLSVSYPFKVNLYLQTALINGNTAVYFNYSVQSEGHNYAGTYDQVVFNSTYGMPAGYEAPEAHYLVSGTQITPTGYLLNDAEIMIGGPGGGSTTSIYGIDGTMSLKYKETSGQALQTQGSTQSQYESVPSAIDFGVDTGETSEGVAVSWNQFDTAYLSSGPSLLYGMWGCSPSTTQMEDFSGYINPTNAFIFVSPGPSFMNGSAAWAPLSLNGYFNFVLPQGDYSAVALLSYYSPAYFNLATLESNNPSNSPQMRSAGHSNVNLKNTISLSYNQTMGIYTPLMAMDNQQLKDISLSGSGSLQNPFIIENKQYMPISSLFYEFNDFLFPVFTGVLLANTNKYVDMNNMPSLIMDYPAFLVPGLKSAGFPTFNYLGYALYDASHVSIFNSTISGWFAELLSGFPVGNLLMWDSSDNLVMNDTFLSMDSSLFIYGGSGNTVFGNVFENYTFNSTSNVSFGNIDLYGAPLGTIVFASGDIIYNNIFNTTITAASPSFSIYTGCPAAYVNEWNVSLRPSSTVSMINGYSLSGSIVNANYQGGNYWYNFNGIIPYNNSGNIEFGGDYEPLNLLMIQDGPLVPAPVNAIVVVPIYAAYVSHNTTSTIINNSVFFPIGSYNEITVTFFDQYISNPFDDSFVVLVNNTQIMAGNTLELENTSATEPVTQYYSILQGLTSVTSLSPQFNPGYASRLSTWFTFYLGKEAQHPSTVIPAFTDINFPTPRDPKVNVLNPYNISRSFNVTFPKNVATAYLNFYEQQNGNDEFWYANEPPFREFRIYINNTLVGTVEPYPNIQTGGGDLFLWQPILAIGAELYPPHQISLMPYISLLHGTQKITVEVINDESLWVRSALNFMLNTTASVVSAAGTPTFYSFSNNYIQSPMTNPSSLSIPSTTIYLNDTEYVNESLGSTGVVVTNGSVTTTSYSKTVEFFANSSEFNVCGNVIIPEASGYLIPIVEYFYLNETTYEYTTTYTQFITSGHINGNFIKTTNLKKEYYQINGTSTEDLFFNSTFSLTSVGIGFNVTQIRILEDQYILSYQVNGKHGTERLLTYNDTSVQGQGYFVGVLNSESEITALLYNHALTIKTINSYTDYNGKLVSFYDLYEVAVNDSLVLRNGVIVTYRVESSN